MSLRLLVLLSLLVPVSAVAGDEPVDLDVVTRIRQEGFHRSQAMDTMREITEGIGPRLTGSPAMRAAHAWAREELTSMGLENARLEAFDFGRGWSFDRCTVAMVAPRQAPLEALPEAWTPGTDGPVRGRAVRMEVESPEDLEKYVGELEGAIVFLDDAREVSPDDAPRFERYTAEELAEVAEFPVPDGRPSTWRKRYRKRWELDRKLDPFLVNEGVLAVVRVSSRDHGIVRVASGGSPRAGESDGVCRIRMAAEHYNTVLRALEDEREVELAIDVRARFHDENEDGHNVLADWPGRGNAKQIVMAGAHLDSWHGGSGATDNAAGVAVVLEAVRILKAIGVRPERTIRVALWSGEEQGLFGSRHHVDAHYATRPAPTDSAQLALPRGLRETTWPIETRDDFDRLFAYFNLDNGAGRVRGIYAEENAAAANVFRAWLAPFADLGAGTVTLDRTWSTDHQPFQQVGLPGFQFVQDGLDYMTRTHHSNLDTYDHVPEEDLKVSSVILASFLYHAAMREEMLPRKPLPQAPPEPRKREREGAGRP